MRVAVLSIANPFGRSHGGTLRTRALIDGLVEAGHDVACLHPGEPVGGPPSVRQIEVPASLGARRWPDWVGRLKRRALPMPTQVGGRNPGISDALRRLAPVDLLVVSQLAQSSYVGELDGAALWLDHSDLDSEFLLTEIGTRRGPTRLTAALQRRQLAALERERSERAAIVTTAGWRDQQVLEGRIDSPVDWLPTPVTEHGAPRRAAADGPVAGFLAHFAFWPNRDGYEVLVRHWAPALRGLGWRVLVAGLDSEELPRSEHVEVVGPVDDVSEFYDRVDVTLAPLRLGGGMKVKVIESLLHGRPVVSTAFGIEGFPPAVRPLVDVVDVRRPDFGMLAEGPPPTPAVDDAELGRFRRAGFRKQVAALLQRLPARTTAG